MRSEETLESFAFEVFEIKAELTKKKPLTYTFHSNEIQILEAFESRYWTLKLNYVKEVVKYCYQ